MKDKKTLVILGISLAFFILLPQTASLAIYNYSEIAELTNQVRIEHNLPPLKLSFILIQSAELKAQDMLNNQYFAHISPKKRLPGIGLIRRIIFIP
ncbi:MAG: hypothetical protein COT24_02295 [Candidatus Kerfeldbacteria bacterium CG08_land_8_20_14_0_20_40_16]|uniref:SCP domain-containing protein n=1 Tax=Candidatus Kerfeldbacteria bacterium CG08_land_8_20_14_0_20_40_16 TaxID=2014244 RepID=A0A2H0YY69_9BACT|nr:MAG: hypothetical protein COT24_02295 [Candidatus Kerfeldbacteria bacterium CG08_land_8_20_14_0_20_40_16]